MLNAECLINPQDDIKNNFLYRFIVEEIPCIVVIHSLLVALSLNGKAINAK